MKIRVGFGTNGDIYADLEKVKACNFCTHFRGYGLHACTGHCFKLDKDVDGDVEDRRQADRRGDAPEGRPERHLERGGDRFELAIDLLQAGQGGDMPDGFDPSQFGGEKPSSGKTGTSGKNSFNPSSFSGFNGTGQSDSLTEYILLGVSFIIMLIGLLVAILFKRRK